MKKNILGIALVATIFSLHAMELEQSDSARKEELRRRLFFVTNVPAKDLRWTKLFELLESPDFAGYDVSNYKATYWGESLLEMATVTNRSVEAKKLLEQYRVDPNFGKISSNGKPFSAPLMMACAKGNIAMIKLLLDYGADVNIRDYQGWNCFDYARKFFLYNTNDFNTYNQILDLLRSTTATTATE